MTKLIMASTADAWLIYVPGMARKHERFMKNLDELVTPWKINRMISLYH
jgi:hypothetical protein